MQLVDALQENATKLAQEATELRDRIAVLQAQGHSATATINELISTCDEIGRINDLIKSELDRSQSAF